MKKPTLLTRVPKKINLRPQWSKRFRKSKKNLPVPDKKLRFNFDKYVFTESWLEQLEHPTRLHSEDCGNVVYMLARSGGSSESKEDIPIYIGETQNIKVRFLQHNCVYAAEEGALDTRAWVQQGFQAEPVLMVRGFKSLHDSRGFETFLQRLRFKQFVNIEHQWKYKKNLLGQALHAKIRRLLIALQTNRWKNYPLQICWFNIGFRPRDQDLNLHERHVECQMPDFSPVHIQEGKDFKSTTLYQFHPLTRLSPPHSTDSRDLAQTQ